MLMAYEVTRDLELKEIEIETPICKTKVQTLANEKIAVIPILRAGLGMADGIMSLIPNAKMGHIGLYPQPPTRFCPPAITASSRRDIADRETIIVDPMLATGNSGNEAIRIIKNGGLAQHPVREPHRRAGRTGRHDRRRIRTWTSM